MQTIPKTLFLGWGVSVVSYYRCFLPGRRARRRLRDLVGDEKP